jgi:hypothetical protein
MIMKLISRWFLVASLIVAATFFHVDVPAANKSDTAPETPEMSDLSPWSAVIDRNWAGWSEGRDTITKMDLIAKMARPEYRGEDAAALAALEIHLRKADAVDRTTAMNINEKRILDAYRKNVLKLRTLNRTLYASGQPNFSMLKQGPAGDCYFFSGTGWMALYRKEVIMGAIRELPDKTYRVVFPNGDEALVTAPTDAEMAFNDAPETLQDGLWMPVLEKATGTIQQRRFPQSAGMPDPTVAIDVAGIPPGTIVKRWTGNPIAKYHLGRKAKREKVRRGLVRMQERNSLAEVLLLKKPAARLMYNHVYAVLGYNDSTGMLKIWNPHGQDFTPVGISGPENGYETRHGVFMIPLDDFMKFFTFLVIEKN